jgi:drug/metabolite transporter (DMT)-like permease
LKSKTNVIFYLFLVFFIWGSTYVFSKIAVDRMPTFVVAFIRYVFAAITLFFMLRKKNVPKVEKKDYKYFIIIGAIGYALCSGLQLLGTKYAGASIASLINSMSPVTIIIAAVILLKEKLTLKKMISLIFVIAGAFIVAGKTSENSMIIGIIFSLVSLTIWSVITVLIRKITQKYDSLQVTAYCMAISAVCNLPAAVIDGSFHTGSFHFDFSLIFSLIFLGTIGTAISQYLWNKCLSMAEASFCSLFYPLQPLSASALGILILGEKITWNFLLGGFFIIVGVLYSILGLGRQH